MIKSDEKFKSRLEKFLQADSKASFVKLLQDHPNEVTNSLVDKCVDFGAKKCLFALLCGDVCNLHPELDAQCPKNGVTALAYIAHSCPDPKVINLMLSKCGAIPLANVCCSIGMVHGLPLHFVLVNLSFLHHLRGWTRGDYLIKLILLLCQWKTKPLLDSARLLAQYTHSVNDIAWTFLKRGGMLQFVALLLVARKKVMAPFDTGFTIHQYIIAEIDSISEGNMSDEQEEYKKMFIDALTIVDVFERAGDDLSSYCSSMQKYVHVERVVADVSGLLRKAQVHVTLWDLKLFHHASGFHRLWRVNLAKLTGPHDDDCLYPFPAPCTSSFNPYIPGAGLVKPIPIPKIVSLGSQPRMYSTTACQGRKISRTAEHTRVSPSSRHLANFAMKLTKGFRYL